MVWQATASAQSKIDALVYKFTDESVFQELSAAECNEALQFIIVADEAENSDADSYAQRLGKLGANVTLWESDAFPKLHSKVAIYDAKLALTGSFNWSKNGLSDSVEVAISVSDKKAVAALQAIFDLVSSQSQAEPERTRS